MNIGEEIRYILNKIKKSEGQRIHMKIRLLGVSLYTFNKNGAELLAILNRFEKDTAFAMELMSAPKRDGKFETTLDEVSRLFHNYLAASMTLVDHTRKFYQDEYQGEHFDEEYNEMKNKTFVENSLAGFIKDIRNYSVHRALPITGATLTYSRDKNPSHTIYLLKSTLLDWDGWKSGGKEFLQKQDDKISLITLVDDYSRLVQDFHNWFKKRQMDIHKDALIELEILNQKKSELTFKVQERFNN